MKQPIANSTGSVSSRAVHSVSAVSGRIRQLIENQLPALWIEGTLSNLVKSAAGHWYFSIKDEKAQLRCVMFRGRNRLVREKLKDGDDILLCGKAGVYEGRGDLQLVVDHLEASGMGSLQARFEKLKRDLLKEGLLDSSSKSSLPTYPTRIGVITSSSGAVIYDMVTVLKRRSPLIQIDLYPSLVQGTNAKKTIVDAIAFANELATADLLVVARGGGSLEDLWAFNEEDVARAIHASKLPVISAVGHETDFTIADMVADLRAPTPSAAAEIISQHFSELPNLISTINNRLSSVLARQIETRRSKLALLIQRVRSPETTLEQYSQKLDGLTWRLSSSESSHLQKRQNQCQQLIHRLQLHGPQARLSKTAGDLQTLRKRLSRVLIGGMQKKCEALRNQKKLLDAFGPMATLERGYAVISKQNGQIVRDQDEVNDAEQLDVRLAKGTLSVQVNS